MKILLTTLNAKYIHSNLALRYLYAVAGRYRDVTEVAEYNINRYDDDLFIDLMRKDADLYCFSCYIWNVERTLYLCQMIKQARPQVHILLGGPEVSYEEEGFLFEQPFVDFVIQGEGEASFAAFLDQYGAAFPDYEQVCGLLWRQDRQVRKNPACPPLKMESIPNPYDFLPAEPDKIVYYESSRGCPFSCTYCLSCLDRRVRALPLDRVKGDLDYFLYKGVPQVKFVDRTFNYDSDRSLALIRHLIEKDNGITNFHFEICGDLMSEAHFQALAQARPGLFQMEIGVQSTHLPTLQAIRRKGDIEAIGKTVRRLQSLGGIHLHLDLIAGLPYEDYSLFRRSFNQVYDLQPDMLQLGFLKLLKGTPLREEAALHDYVYRQKPPYEVLTNRYISAEGLVRLKMIAQLVDLYYNRGGFSRSLEAALSEGNTAFDFFEALAVWYYDKGYGQRPHSKENLYGILLSFLQEWGEGENRSRLRECLLQDAAAAMSTQAAQRLKERGEGPL